jgi:hypothetical protein
LLQVSVVGRAFAGRVGRSEQRTIDFLEPLAVRLAVDFFTFPAEHDQESLALFDLVLEFYIKTVESAVGFGARSQVADGPDERNGKAQVYGFPQKTHGQLPSGYAESNDDNPGDRGGKKCEAKPERSHAVLLLMR